MAGFLSNLFGRKGAPVSAVPDGQRVYAIGDIHGHDALFAQLLAMIEADEAARPAAETTIVLLGDLVDRGPDSRGVVDRAIRLGETRAVRSLMGNHEEVFLQALKGDEDALKMLIRVGGDATLVSYGISGIEVAGLEPDALVWRLASAVPQAHIDYLAAMENQIQIGDYLFVHAGIRPGVALHLQKSADLRWIREPFLSHKAHHGVMVVHGHSITPEAELRDNRLGIDTGAYQSGVLTAIGLEGEERWLLQTNAHQA